MSAALEKLERDDEDSELPTGGTYMVDALVNNVAPDSTIGQNIIDLHREGNEAGALDLIIKALKATYPNLDHRNLLPSLGAIIREYEKRITSTKTRRGIGGLVHGI